MIKSLPSYWKGTVFRSRIEARWAVFFDVIKLRWEYEPEGFVLDDGTWYLPDFWLPEMKRWVEVKPEIGATDSERAKIEGLVKGSGYGCLLLSGSPWPQVYEECTRDRGLSCGFDWWAAYFSDAHTVHRRSGSPRMFYDWITRLGDELWVEAAMQTARRMDLRDPDAGRDLPAGWEGVLDVFE